MTDTSENKILEPTIFHEKWWLDIATGGKYGMAEYTEQGKVVGRLPYFIYDKFGMKMGSLPPLTHFLGPAVNAGQGKECTKFLKRLEVTSELIRQLPATASFYIKCHRDITETVAFQGAGFRTSVQFTNELHPKAVDLLWNDIRTKPRNNIRAARDGYTVSEGNDPERFMDFYDKNIEGRGEKNNKDIPACTRLVAACLERKRGRILESRDNRDGSLAASVFYAWDDTSAYYLMTTHKRDAHRGATALAVWEAICDSAKRGLIFDFDGIYSEGCAKSANDFSASFSPRYIVRRESAPMRVMRAAQSLISEKSFYF
jgi:hypothetical protein